MYAECGVGQHDVFLGGQCAVFQHAVEYLGSLFLGGAAHEFFGLGNLEAEVAGLEDAFVLPGGHLEVAGEADLVVAVD